MDQNLVYILSRIDALREGQIGNNRLLSNVLDNQDRNHHAVLNIERQILRLLSVNSERQGKPSSTQPQMSLESFMKTVVTGAQWIMAILAVLYVMKGGSPADLHSLSGLR